MDQAAIVLGDGELSEWRSVAVTDLDEYVPGRLSRRIRTAMSAVDGPAAYAEYGLKAGGEEPIS